MMSMPSRRMFAAVSLISGVLLLGACGEEDQRQEAAEPPPPAVSVAKAAQKAITPTAIFSGRVEAVDSVDLRARVEGFIEQRLFEEGDAVKAGDLLFVIEKGAYEAQVAQIQGQITAAEGTLRLAEIEVERQTTLVQRQASAQVQLDEAQAKYTQAVGDLQRLEAALDQAELDVSYTAIRAPIDGRISRSPFSVGDVVGPSSGPLATIVSQDPIYVTFPVSAHEYLQVLKRAEDRGLDAEALRVKLRLPDGSTYSKTGAINFVDVQVDPTTDTVTIRATIPNTPVGSSGHILIDNELVNVIVEQTEHVQALVVPQAAVAADQAGPYVLVVGQGGKVEQRRISLGNAQGTEVIVTEGLREGEQVIVEGLQKVRPGQVVKASARSGLGDA